MTIGYVAWGISCETYDICERSGGQRNSRVFSLQNTYAEVTTLAICFARSSGCPREARVSRTSASRLAANASGVAFGRPKNLTKSAGTGPGTCQRREIDQRRRQDLQRPSGDDLPRHRGIGTLCYFSVPLSRTGLYQSLTRSGIRPSDRHRTHRQLPSEGNPPSGVNLNDNWYYV